MKGDVNMVSTSKILTVSYGTFSCTLEGFDDSFETMKAIAEYFRDLAADDRYFGAEPPTPDAEMLARIAERELARRVEAREERGGIVLRAAEIAASAAPAPGTAAQPAGTGETSAATEEPRAPVAEAPALQEEPEAPAPDAESAGAEAEPPVPETEDIADDTQTEIAGMPVETDWAEDDAGSAETEMPVAEVAEDEAAEPETAETETVTVEAEEVAVVSTTTDDNSIAAKLQRIRAVVSRNTTEVADYSEDQHADSFVEPEMASLEAVLSEGADADAPAETAEDDDTTLADILAETRPEEDEPAETAQEAETAEAGREAAEQDAPDDLEAELQALVASAPEAGEDTGEASAPEIEDTLTLEAEARVDEEDEDDVAGILDKLASLSDEAPDDIPADNADEVAETDEAEDELGAFLSGLADDDAAEDEAKDEDTAEITEAPAPLRARVVKMKRADFEEAIAQGHLEETDDEDDWNALGESDLSPEEEADLQAELAEVEAELNDEDAEAFDYDDEAGDEIDSIFAETDDDNPDLQDRRRARDQLDEAASERDMNRLMAKTNSEMDEPDSANRRSAIQHLRAAVAATRADKEAGVGARQDTISEAFREDLASVVRPRRPRTEGSGTARPTEPARPAPLKLVAEQRIDAPSAPPAPVRPRRVSMADIHEEPRSPAHASEDGDSFADYAESMGAHNLPEILEAAASYLSFVEGRDQFSRPQLMTRARSVIGDDFSREDGLRSFGQLLRQGKIQKLKGGRFTVSDDIGFQPGERRVG